MRLNRPIAYESRAIPATQNLNRLKLPGFLLVGFLPSSFLVIVAAAAVTPPHNQYILQLVSFLRTEALPLAVAPLPQVMDHISNFLRCFLKGTRATIFLVFKYHRFFPILGICESNGLAS